MRLSINQEDHDIETESDTPLLWVLREELGLRGTKFGCGIGQCGACTVQLNGVATRSCVLPAIACVGSEITTIEGLGPHPVQEAWIAEQVPQCGYCQGGQVLCAAQLLESNRNPSDSDINAAMTNICRCATYDRMRKAIKRAAQAMGPLPAPESEAPEEIDDSTEETE